MVVETGQGLSRREVNSRAAVLFASAVVGIPAMMLCKADHLTSLMQTWQFAFERYDKLHNDESVGGLRDLNTLHEPRRQMVSALAAVMDTPAQCHDDVLQKYRALDGSLIFTKTPRDFSEDRYQGWCLMLEREASRYLAHLRPFWRGAA